MDADTAAANVFADSSAARWDVASVLQQEPQLLPSSPPQEQEVLQLSVLDHPVSDQRIDLEVLLRRRRRHADALSQG